MSDQPYNLLDEAWICVVDSAGAARRVSLLGVMTRHVGRVIATR